MTGEQSVLVFGILSVVLFIALLSRSGKKKAGTEPSSTTPHVARTSKSQNRTQRRKR
jgi:hypothetical protein